MAKRIVCQLPELPVTRNDIVFQINEPDGRVGQLQISQGGITWFPVNAQKGKIISWDKLIDFISDFGKATSEKKG